MKDTPDFVDSSGRTAEDGITPYGINYELFIISVYVGLWVKICEKSQKNAGNPAKLPWSHRINPHKNTRWFGVFLGRLTG